MRRKLAIAIVVILMTSSIFSAILFFTNEAKFGPRGTMGTIVKKGKYYIITYPDNQIEVSREQWTFTKNIKIICPINTAFALLIFIYLSNKIFIPYSLYNKNPEAAFEASQNIKKSGNVINLARCGGSIGKFKYSNQLLKVELYHKGFGLNHL